MVHDFFPLLFLVLSNFGNTGDVFSQSYPGCIYSNNATGPCHARTEREEERGGERYIQTEIDIHTDKELSDRESRVGGVQTT